VVTSFFVYALLSIVSKFYAILSLRCTFHSFIYSYSFTLYCE